MDLKSKMASILMGKEKEEWLYYWDKLTFYISIFESDVTSHTREGMVRCSVPPALKGKSQNYINQGNILLKRWFSSWLS